MKKISFIGIGLMGLPMARNLLKAGFSLKAYNRTVPNQIQSTFKLKLSNIVWKRRLDL